MTDPTIFNQFLIWPFINALMVFYAAFRWAMIPGALGWAIISLTLVVRGALHPLTAKQLESARKMQELKPHIDKLQKKHKDDKQKLQQEQLKLYQEHGINPAAGCLPLLLQFPILIALYRMFLGLLSNGNLSETVDHINQIVYAPWLKIESLDLSFFGLNLAQQPSAWKEAGWWLLLIPVITGVLQWYQTKQMMPKPAEQSVEDMKKGKGKEKEKGNDNFAAELQKQMAFIMPVMIGFFAYNFPLGLSLYWNTFTVFSLVNTNKKSTPAKQTTAS
ncbi:hypothetical protein A3B56_01715 [Candidatus Roizmanbacteria bacterium RIFCSPLOWO2_01_FULL_45_11]|uniref:Membrane insertase YidC/Oxa/ALB C-terminal domain-containing protein n=1 Tax=Candidatus Roizmanbacteria bacterium RIFCSPLOWO2_01_FULL_45_11 TaxID=1802070 RepID=A0A1F7JGF9_9BACT|nr:MAG: hypothetical protein A3B56_01715 [Candidatus Roizmanbacteria bacterium RIFCSPLOWO2_01_FULL_45_11]